jgi:hypothetical protein
MRAYQTARQNILEHDIILYNCKNVISHLAKLLVYIAHMKAICHTKTFIICCHRPVSLCLEYDTQPFMQVRLPQLWPCNII